MGDQPIWEGPSGNWIQDDEKKRFLILNRNTGDKEGNQSGLDVIVGAKWHSTDTSDCGGFFPPEFDHCPYCGKALTQVINHQSDMWVPPFGSGNGLRLASSPINPATFPIKNENNKQWIDQEQASFALPRPHGDYEFIIAPAGTKLPVLLTFDRTTGLLDYFSPSEKKWTTLTSAPGRRVGESKLPEWAWSAAFVSGKPGIAVPTNEGPVWLAIDWSNGICNPIFGQGEAVGGIATFENQVFTPVIVEGLITIHTFDFAALQWKQLGQPLTEGVRTSGDARYYSVPVIDAGRHIIYWIGIDGLLSFDQANGACGWRPWETDEYPCRAIPELGPPYHDTFGYFWQICYDDHDNSEEQDAFRYYKLSGDESDREDVDGGRFSSGISCFSRLYEFWDKPWAKVDVGRQDKSDFIRVPLLSLDEKSKITITANFGFGSTTPLLKLVKDKGKTYHTEFSIESPGDPPVELRMPYAFNIQTPWELRSFIFQSYLYVYSSEEAVCYKWRLK